MEQIHFGWGPKWHRNLTQVIEQSWGIFLILQHLNLLVIQEHTGCSSRGALDSYHLASYEELPRTH